MRKKTKNILITLFLSLIGILLLLWTLSTKPLTTPEDEKYLQAYLDKWELAAYTATTPGNFLAELTLITRIQDSVIHNLQGYNKPIPKEKVGCIRYYFENNTGACYDRALLMEKLFARLGFQTRHAFVLFRGDGSPTRMTDIFSSKLPSHALIEVKTAKGWMVIDTQDAWMGLDENQNPLTLGALRNKWRSGEQLNLTQNHKIPAHLSTIYQEGHFRFLYGLYSRHGGFLPHRPWVTQLRKWGAPIPDYNFSQVLMNLF